MKTIEYKCHTCVHGTPLSCDSPIYCDDNNSGYEPKQTDGEVMTVEEYRERMIKAFQNADCEQFIALVCLPTEKEFEHLEWFLRKEFGKERKQTQEGANDTDK